MADVLNAGGGLYSVLYIVVEVEARRLQRRRGELDVAVLTRDLIVGIQTPGTVPGRMQVSLLFAFKSETEWIRDFRLRGEGRFEKFSRRVENDTTMDGWRPKNLTNPAPA
jgi:hypothetical protein